MKYQNLPVLTAAVIAVTTSIVLLFAGCDGSSGSSNGGVNFGKDASYALGLNIGTGLKDGLAADGVSPNINELLKGMKDGLTGKNPRFDLMEARNIIESTFDAVMEEKGAKVREEGNTFLAENAGKPGISITPSGLQYEVLSEGTGAKPSAENVVKVHYEGRLIDGTLFDNSYEYQEPVVFPLNGVIPGWTEGLQLMPVGSKYKFYIPSELGYGAYGAGASIPPNAVLIFTVELLEIVE
ncbi:MAG: FKBP-type peptidyl-prolyl cis-trans isomerase [Treponema sp.]|nr:FKBP-type peptidyl-prolyl cis-trans isomerase [Treponema sp.]